MMGHDWDRDGERCLKCGDKDWFAGPECSADAPPKQKPVAYHCGDPYCGDCPIAPDAIRQAAERSE